jgi:hypothetical protein
MSWHEILCGARLIPPRAVGVYCGDKVVIAEVHDPVSAAYSLSAASFSESSPPPIRRRIYQLGPGGEGLSVGGSVYSAVFRSAIL